MEHSKPHLETPFEIFLVHPCQQVSDDNDFQLIKECHCLLVICHLFQQFIQANLETPRLAHVATCYVISVYKSVHKPSVSYYRPILSLTHCVPSPRQLYRPRKEQCTTTYHFDIMTSFHKLSIWFPRCTWALQQLLLFTKMLQNRSVKFMLCTWLKLLIKHNTDLKMRP